MTVSDDRASGDIAQADIEETQGVPEISFPAGMPGFPEARTFHLDPLDDSGAVFALRNLEQAGLRFIVVPPALFFPGYAPHIDEQTAEQLGLQDDDEPLLLVVITPGDSVEQATGNLMAPVVVNPRTRRATQMVMSGSDQPLRAPLRS